MIDNSFEDFLLNDELQSGVFINSINGKMKVIKEKYDDRFDVLYFRHFDNDRIERNDFNVGGYYDKKDKCIYNADFYIDKLLVKDGNIRVSFFHNLLDKIINETSDNLKKYILENQDNLKKIGMLKFKNDDKWQIDRYKKEVQKEFIMNDECIININTSFLGFKFNDIRRLYNGDLYIDYLKKPNEVVSMCSNMIINDEKEKLGYELLIYIFKNDYLQSIIKNSNHEFDDVYISRKLLHSLKFDGFYPKQINITIRYNKKDFTFKFDYSKLMSDIINGNTASWDYKNNYTEVSDFIKENNDKDNDRYTTDFEFSHIKSITYGKRELYRNDDIDKMSKSLKGKDKEL